MKILMYVFLCVGSFLTVGAAGSSDNGGDLWEAVALAIVGVVLSLISVFWIKRKEREQNDDL